MNKVIVKGRFTKEIELQTSNGGTAYIRNSVAVDRKYAKGEEKQTDFFNIAAFGKTAEFIGKYFHKGSQILISGRLQSDSYTDKNGNKQSSVTIMIEEADFCDSKADGSAEKKPGNDFLNVPEGLVEELPFS